MSGPPRTILLDIIYCPFDIRLGIRAGPCGSGKGLILHPLILLVSTPVRFRVGSIIHVVLVGWIQGGYTFVVDANIPFGTVFVNFALNNTSGSVHFFSGRRSGTGIPVIRHPVPVRVPLGRRTPDGIHFFTCRCAGARVPVVLYPIAVRIFLGI